MSQMTILRVLALLLCNVVSSSTSLSDPVTVFQRGEGGYYCIKIPVLLATPNYTLLAFGEGRMLSCSDFTWTDLIYKRSEDGGKTWGPLSILYSNSSTGEHNVIGNAAPVALAASSRILVPFCRNNRQVMLTHSDDDGLTWSSPVNLTGVTQPDWSWVGTGPPGSIQLDSGRVVVPSYHSLGPKLDGDFSKAHMMISDDQGKTWYIGGSVSDGLQFPNENQVASLGGDLIFMNARSILSDRVGAYSRDGGLTFDPPFTINGLTQPLTGCQGSTILQSYTETLFYSGPSVPFPSTLRYNMSVFTSTDNGQSWSLWSVVHLGAAAYSSMALFRDGQTIGLLYEWSKENKRIFDPDYFSFVIISSFVIIT